MCATAFPVKVDQVMKTRRLMLALTVVAVSIISSASPAYAHATLVQSDPADGSALDEAPESVTLTFNETVSPDSSAVELVDVDGNSYPVEIIGHDGGDDSLLVVFGDVPDGLYSLRWTAFSASDGHITKGMIVWGFGAGADLSQASFPDASKPVPPSEVALRWAMFVGLALMLGGLVVEGIVLTSLRERFAAESDRPWHLASTRFAATWAWRGAVLASAAVLSLVAHQLWSISTATGQSMGDLVQTSLVSTSWGQWAIIRFLAVVAAAVILKGRPRLTGSRGLLVALGAVALLAEAAAGHAAGTETPLFSIANDTLHLAAALSWVGGVFVLWQILRNRGVERPDRLGAIALKEFSPFAEAALAATLVTGLLAIGPLITSVDSFIGTAYGQTMIVKLLAIGVVLILALATRRGLSPKGSHRRIGRESMATAVVIAAAAILTASAPATGITWMPVVNAESRQLAVVRDDVQLAMQITPNVPGQNLVLIDATSTRIPVPAPIDRVLVRVTPLDLDVETATFDVDPTGSVGEYQIPTTRFSVPGDYDVQVVIRRLGLPDVTADFRWTVSSAAGGRAVRVSDASIAGVTSTLGAAGVVVFLILLIWRGVAAMIRDRRLRSVEQFLIEDELHRGKVDP